MKSPKLVIGLTGGIASGKSQVSQYFLDLNIDIIDSDKIAKDLFRSGSVHLKKLRDQFGDGIFFANNELNRKALGKLVFSDSQQLEWLNNFTHPLINQETKNQLSSATSEYAILDIPLLIDKQGTIPPPLKLLIDRVLVIHTQLETQINRISVRDHLNKEQALKIIQTQSSNSQKLALADDVIDNNGTLQQLKIQVKSLHKKYRTM